MVHRSVAARSCAAGSRPRAFLLATSSMLVLCALPIAAAQSQTVTYSTGQDNSTPIVLIGPGTLDVPSASEFARQSGTISGNFGITKIGSGYLQLAGVNTYTGGTVLQEGGLWVLQDSALGTGSLSMADGTWLRYGAGKSIANDITLGGTNALRVFDGELATQAGVIGGGGRLKKEMSGTLVLSGANTYSGGTEIESGTLRVEHNNALGTGAVMMRHGTTLDYADGVNVANAIDLARLPASTDPQSATFNVTTGAAAQFGSISESNGPFGLTKTGAGALILAGTNTYTGATNVSDGILVIAASRALPAATALTIGSSATLEVDADAQVSTLAGQGKIVLNHQSFTVGATNASSVFEGQVEGTGNIVKLGTGTLEMRENQGDFTDGRHFLVRGGKLLVNSNYVTTDATVSAGATLGGSGLLGTITISDGAIVAPGDSLIQPNQHVGTLRAMRDIVFNPTSIYQVDINAQGQSDKIVVSQSATLNGTVQVLAASGNYAPSTTYTILHADNGITGRFANVTSNLAFLTPALAYGTNDVTLTMTRNSTAFAGITGLTRNQSRVAAATEKLGTGNAIYDTVVAGTSDGARSAFGNLAGEIHGSTTSALLQGAQYVQDTVIGRMRQSFGDGTGAHFAALDAPGPALAYAPEVRNAMAAVNPADRVLTTWGQAFGGWGRMESDGNAPGLKQSTGGFLAGLDGTFDQRWRAGIAAGYSHASLNSDATPSSGTIDSYHLAGYAAGRFGALSLRLGSAYTWHDVDTTRTVAFGAFSDRTTANYDARSGQVFGEVGYGLALGRFALEPFAGLSYVNVRTHSFTETGGAAALTGFGGANDTTFSTLGVRGAAQLPISGASPITAYGTLGWRHAFDGIQPLQSLAFASGGSPFTIEGVAIARDSLVVETGLNWVLTASTAVGVGYWGYLADNGQTHAFKGNIAVKF